MNWLALSLVVMILNSIAILLIKYVSKKMKSEVMSAYLFSVIAIFLIIFHVLFLEESFLIPERMIIPLLIMGFSGSATYLLLYKSISIAPNAGYSVAIVSLSLVFITLISTFILGTSLTLLKFLGIIIATLGMIFLAWLK